MGVLQTPALLLGYGTNIVPLTLPSPAGRGNMHTYSLQPPHLLLRPECHPIQDEKYLFLKIALRRERERCGHRVTDLPHHRAQLVKPLRRLFRDGLGGERVQANLFAIHLHIALIEESVPRERLHRLDARIAVRGGVPVAHERSHQLAVGGGIATERVRSGLDRALEHQR